MAKKRLSLVDLAKELNVSTTTVSFVLNGRADEMSISKKTQEKVLALAKKRNYHPNALARNLRLGRTLQIGLLVPNIADPFFAEMARSLEHVARKQNYRVMFGNTSGVLETEMELVEMMRSQSADGIFLVPHNPDSIYIKELLDDKYPFVLLDRKSDSLSTSSVTVQNAQGFYDLTSSLIQRFGCKRPVLFMLDLGVVSLNERKEGFQQALKDNGLEYDSSLVFDIDDQNIKQDVKARLAEVLNGPEPSDAILCSNDIIAMPVLWGLNLFHKDQLNSVSIGSFDNLDLFDFCTPRVSSVEQPTRAMVERAFEILMKQINQPDGETECEVLALDLIER